MRTQDVESTVSASQSVREVIQQLAEEEEEDNATVPPGVQPADSAAAAAQPGEVRFGWESGGFSVHDKVFVDAM